MNEAENRKKDRLDFVGIGAQKSATTWLFQCLKEHPQVGSADMEENKELNFFNYHYAKGYHWYHSRFTFDRVCAGEYSVLYLYDRNVPRRLSRYNPDIRIIVSLRNPVERAYSQHLHEIKEGNIPQKLYSFSEALKYNPTYLDLGRYAECLNRYLEYFTKDQIHIVLFDDIRSDPQMVLKKLFGFLGLDPAFLPPSADKIVYKTHLYKSHRLNRAINSVSSILGKGLGRSYSLLKKTGLPALIRRYNEMPVNDVVVPPLTAEDREFLADCYRDEIERLEELIGKDLSSWKG